MDFFYDETGICGCKFTKNNVTNYYYYLKNAQGDVVEIYNSSGVCVVKYAYDAYGKCTTVSYTDADILSYNQIKYRGYYYDKCVNLYRLGSRFYDPNTGRFISPDTIDYLDTDSTHGVNLYAYCNDNPINYYDPTGHSLVGIIASIVVAAILGASVNAIAAATVGEASAKEIGLAALAGFAIGLVSGTLMSFAGMLSVVPSLALSATIGAGTSIVNTIAYNKIMYQKMPNKKSIIVSGLLGGIAGILSRGINGLLEVASADVTTKFSYEYIIGIAYARPISFMMWGFELGANQAIGE